ncbi:hypothetical protein V1264_021840 [Littorina saxatilis]|uniref:Uncharacterized protein n=1 Tax=Littorina saxatilis TaxID=31220 RepID=A0AAN9AJ11_9CAEN
MEEKSKIGCIPNCVITYEEPRVNRIRSICLSMIYWLLMFAVAMVIAGYFMGYKKGYQDIVPVESAVTTKLYGVDDTNTSDQTIWDNADYMIPPKVGAKEL